MLFLPDPNKKHLCLLDHKQKLWSTAAVKFFTDKFPSPSTFETVASLSKLEPRTQKEVGKKDEAKVQKGTKKTRETVSAGATSRTSLLASLLATVFF